MKPRGCDVVRGRVGAGSMDTHALKCALLQAQIKGL
jgi:hypothetical protein